MNHSFHPVLGRQILTTTLLASAILLLAGILLFFLAYQCRGRGPVSYVLLINACFICLLLFGSTAFRIRAYDLTAGSLVIRLGIGKKVFPLAGLSEARIVEKPFAGARRTMGIGGLWSMYGLFSSPDFGAFSAYAANTSSGVLLSWPDRKVLVTPDNPSVFLESVRAAK